MKKLRLLFDTSRPISWINTAYPFAAGYLLLVGKPDAMFWVSTLFFLIPYNLLMYGVNDVYDYESDILNPRKGGIEGAVTPRIYHKLILRAAVLSALPPVVVMVALGSLVSSLALAVILFFVVAYSLKGLRFKEVPILDSITSSLHFVGPLLFAYALAPEVPAEAWQVAGAFFCWGVASQAFGAVQDIVPDRAVGISSVATVLGSKATVRLALVLHVVSSGLVGLIGTLPAVVVGVVGISYALNVVPYLNVSDGYAGLARQGWRRFIWLNYIVGALVTITLLYARLISS